MALRHLLHHLLPLPSLLSTLSLISLARLAIHLPRWLLLLLIPLQFTFLSLLTYLNAPKGVAWTKWEQLGKRDEVVLALHLVGGTGAVVWGVRGTPVGVVLVLEVSGRTMNACIGCTEGTGRYRELAGGEQGGSSSSKDAVCAHRFYARDLVKRVAAWRSV